MKRFWAILLSAALVLAVGPFAAAASDALFTPGVFTGTAMGYGGIMYVEVEVSETEILSVTVVDHRETPGIGDFGIMIATMQIVDLQSLAVDNITGVTVTLQAVVEAAKLALMQAGADIDRLLAGGGAAGVAAGDAIYLETEVLIIGSGGAGMSAAVELQDVGVDVIVIEQLAFTGGNTRVAGSAVNAVNPGLQQRIEMTDSEMEFLLYLMDLEPVDEYMERWMEGLRRDYEAYVAAGHTHLFDSIYLHMLQTHYGGDFIANPTLIEMFVREALDVIDWLSDLGVEWDQNIGSAVGSTWIRSHRPTFNFGPRGNDFVEPQIIRYTDRNGVLLTEHRATELILDGDRVVGATGVTGDGTQFTIMASRGVVMATGGFGFNVEMREYFNVHWHTLAAHVPTTNLPTSTGEGIMMSRDIGASLIDMEWIQLVPAAGAFAAGGGIDNNIFVNSSGERFVREDGRRDDMSAAILAQPGSFFWTISDGNLVDNMLGGINAMTGQTVRDTVDNETVFMADTLEELAELIGVDYDRFTAALDGFNAAVAGEAPCPFGRLLFEHQIGGQAPFFATRGIASVHYTMGGLEVNELFQVLDNNGDIIPGFYAVGEVIGGVHGTNRLGANAIAEVLAHGRILGQLLGGVR